MKVDTAIALCAIVLVMLWPIHQELTIRALRHSLRRMHERQAQHARALVHLQTTMANTPLQVHQPMPTVGRRLEAVPPRPLGLPNAKARITSTRYECPADPDQTLRLGPPPSLTRIDDACKAAGLMTVPREALARIAAIEHHLAGRSATRMELARALDVQPWEVAADLHTAVLAKIVTTTSGHTAGEATYRLCDPTIRMDSMPILWGAR